MEDGYSSYNSLYDTTSLLQFCNDDSASATSGMEVTDRIASLEQRVQMQEDEIQLLKSALADVVRRLNVSEEQHAVQNRKGPTKARPLVQTLPLRTTINNGTIVPKKPSGSSPSSGARKETISPATKSKSESLLNTCKLNKANPSTVKRTSSTELVSAGGRRESFGDAKSSRNRTGSTSSSSSSKKNSESKPKEPMFSAGKRRVTHCKVTVQVLLTPTLVGVLQTKKEPFDFMVDPQDRTSVELGHTPTDVHKMLALSLPRSSSSSQSIIPFPHSPSFKTALKSPSHYFQICY